MKTSIKIVGSTLGLIAASLGLYAQATNPSNSNVANPPTTDTAKAAADQANDQTHATTDQAQSNAQNAADNTAATTTSTTHSPIGTNKPVRTDNALTTNGSQPGDPTRGPNSASVAPAAGTDATPPVTADGHATTTTNADANLTPTGKTSAEMQQERMNAGKDYDASKDGHAKNHANADKDDDGHHKGQDQDHDHDKDAGQTQDDNSGATTPTNR